MCLFCKLLWPTFRYPVLKKNDNLKILGDFSSLSLFFLEFDQFKLWMFFAFLQQVFWIYILNPLLSISTVELENRYTYISLANVWCPHHILRGFQSFMFLWTNLFEDLFLFTFLFTACIWSSDCLTNLVCTGSPTNLWS